MPWSVLSAALLLLLLAALPAAAHGGRVHMRFARVDRAGRTSHLLKLAALETPQIANSTVVQRMVQAALAKSATLNLSLARTKDAADAAAFNLEQRLGFHALMARWEPLIGKAAKKFGVPATWIREVMQIESGGRTMMAPTMRIMSSEGAVGLMQIQPGTYAEMRAQYRLGADPFNPRDNIYAGAAYLRWLRGKYGYPQMFEAYDDGPGHLEQRVTTGQILPAETQNYVKAVMIALGDKNALSALTAATSPAASTTAAPLLAPEPIAPVVQNVAMNTNCIFTQLDGSPFVVDCLTISSVRMPMFDTRSPGENSIITVGDRDIRLRDDEARVIAQITAHGGRV